MCVNDTRLGIPCGSLRFAFISMLRAKGRRKKFKDKIFLENKLKANQSMKIEFPFKLKAFEEN